MAHDFMVGDIVRVKNKETSTYKWFNLETLLIIRTKSAYYPDYDYYVDVSKVDGSPIEKPDRRSWVHPVAIVEEVEIDPFLTAVRRRRHGA